MKIFILAFIAALLFNTTYSQNLTGTWEGRLGNDQFLQLNILHTSKGICGYTYDYGYGSQSSNYCKANFNAVFKKEEGKLITYGTSFIENSGNHVLMTLKLKYRKNENGVEILEYKNLAKSIIVGLLSAGMIQQNEIYLRKVADKPANIFAFMQKCQEEPKVDTPAKPKLPDYGLVGPKYDPSIYAEEPKKDSVKPIVKDTVKLVPVVPKLPVEIAMEARKTDVVNNIKINTNLISISIYDNGTVDGDTVSVFHNGKLILAHQRLTGKPIELKIEVNKNNPRHEITLFAENLGSMPPNTALLIVQAGSKRYELRSTADLTKNASVIFEYSGD
jgi:hypothetical protein